MNSLMDRYRKEFHSYKLCVFKCTENQILADLYFSALCINRQYCQNLVTAKCKCFTVVLKWHYYTSKNLIPIIGSKLCRLGGMTTQTIINQQIWLLHVIG